MDLLAPHELALENEPREKLAAFLRGGQRKVPRFLYRFKQWDSRSTFASVVESTLRLASPSTFNDPFDVRACITLDGWTMAEQRKYLFDNMREQGIAPSKRDLIASHMLADGLLISELQAAFDKNIAEIGVCCFAGHSRSARSTLMWSHYAKEHTGVCLQYRTISAPSVLWRAHAVEYVNDVLRIGWIDKVARRDALYSALHRKSDAWAYEREHRIIFPDAAGRDLAFSPRALTSVILGCKAPRVAEDEVVDMCRARVARGHPPVRLLRATMTRCSYGLTLRLALDLEERARR